MNTTQFLEDFDNCFIYLYMHYINSIYNFRENISVLMLVLINLTVQSQVLRESQYCISNL